MLYIYFWLNRQNCTQFLYIVYSVFLHLFICLCVFMCTCAFFYWHNYVWNKTMDGWMDGQMDGRMDGWILYISQCYKKSNKMPKAFGEGCTTWPRVHGTRYTLHVQPRTAKPSRSHLVHSQQTDGQTDRQTPRTTVTKKLKFWDCAV